VSQKHGATVKDVAPAKFIAAFAAYLKKSGKVEVPAWVDLVKTGTHKELAPYDPDWYYVRTAAVARKIYIQGGIGVGKLTKYFGGGKKKNTATHFCAGSGSVARASLKSLTKLGFIAIDEKGGRKITPAGQRDLDRIARSVVLSQ
jgi:small subunit ribosomal protein S19e